MMKRTVVCGICGLEYSETAYGKGFPEWGQLSGAALDGDKDPYLCPKHKADIFNHVDKLKRFNEGTS